MCTRGARRTSALIKGGSVQRVACERWKDWRASTAGCRGGGHAFARQEQGYRGATVSVLDQRAQELRYFCHGIMPRRASGLQPAEGCAGRSAAKAGLWLRTHAAAAVAGCSAALRFWPSAWTAVPAAGSGQAARRQPGGRGERGSQPAGVALPDALGRHSHASKAWGHASAHAAQHMLARHRDRSCIAAAPAGWGWWWG